EGFMETFQELREDPELELRSWIEQILPERRQMRLYSAPTYDEAGLLVGRIDVYTDVTEGMQRSAEIEQLYEEARGVAESYQRSLLPSQTPSVPRLNLVAHYVPAAGRRAVCGDFYDFVPLSDGKVGITLGDVCGIGPAAVNDAALARYTLRSLAADQSDLSILLERLNHQIVRQSSSERFTRVLLGALDPERAVLEYVNAGHVPPIVYRAGRQEIEWLGEGGIALGIEEDVQYKCARVQLSPGDMVVFYTDGVTDAWRRGRPLGQGKLSDLVTEYGVGTPGELVQAIRRAVEAWVYGGEPRDDVTLVAVQVVPDATIAEEVRELVLPNEPARVAEVRAFVAGFLVDVRAPVEASQEYLLAVGEAAANAYRYGRKPEGRSEVRVRCRIERSSVVTSISDEGRGFDPEAVQREGLPDRFASGGRGLFLMRQLTDDITYEVDEQGTTVTLRRRMFGPRAHAPRPWDN
ncbi:MAG: ATP-binding SpoIIE family protein phosphatase, partial [Actinomycetota bacterium]